MKTRMAAGMIVQITSSRWLPWKYWALRTGLPWASSSSAKRYVAQTRTIWVPMKTMPVIQRMMMKRLSISRPKVEIT